MARTTISWSAVVAILSYVVVLFAGTSTANVMRALENMQHRRNLISRSKVDSSTHSTSANSTSFRYLNKKTAPYQVKSLPDINFDLGELYSGQILVNASDPSRKAFFVYQPKVGKPSNDLVVFLQGGPGCSGLESFLQETGKFIWGWSMYTPQENPYTWVNLANVLWVEYPIGTGFSVGDVTAQSEEETAEDFVGFLRNFQEKFDIINYRHFITGESYAGRFVPYVASAMIDQECQEYFNVSGAILYDPVIGKFDYVQSQIPTLPFVKQNANLFNLNSTFMSYLENAHEQCGYKSYIDKYLTYPPPGNQPALQDGMPMNNNTDCDVYDNVNAAVSVVNPCFNGYEISAMCPLPSDPLGFPGSLLYQYPGMGGIYFNRTDVKKAMHAPLDVDWQECGGPVFKGNGGQYGNGDHSADPIQKVLPKVIEHTNRVLVSNGDLDFVVLTQGTLLSIQNMTWHGQLGFQKKPSTEIDIKLPDLQYQNVYAQNGDKGGDGPGQGIMGIQHFERGLMWAETYQSGHMQPQFQPRSSYRHVQWMLGQTEVI